jgi:hypothetical protein
VNEFDRDPVEVGSFAEQARAFCHFVTAEHPPSKSEQLRQLAIHIGKLYVAGLALPEVNDSSNVGVEIEPPPWSSTHVEHYWEVFDPLEHSQPVAGSLGDDVRDIYCDVMRGLRLYDDPALPWTAAAWEWRFHLQHHWGNHAVDALRVLQRALHREP